MMLSLILSPSNVLASSATGCKRSTSASPPAVKSSKSGRLVRGLPFVPSPLPNLRERLNSTPANVRDLKLPPESRLVAVSDCPADDLYEVEATWPTVTFCYDKLPTT